jgi:hypothetical protein
MEHTAFLVLLKKLRACDEALYWVKNNVMTSNELWNACERGDWLWWFLVKQSPSNLPSLEFANAARADAYAAVARADAADAADGDTRANELKIQANWIREHCTCPIV